jgi:hypothetical protein
LGNSTTITTAGEDQFTVSAVLSTNIASTPEPASIVMLLTSVPLALVAARRLRRRGVAAA